MRAKGMNSVLDAGARMSNILFNIAQDERTPLDWRTAAKEQQTQLDKARDIFHENFTKL